MLFTMVLRCCFQDAFSLLAAERRTAVWYELNVAVVALEDVARADGVSNAALCTWPSSAAYRCLAAIVPPAILAWVTLPPSFACTSFTRAPCWGVPFSTPGRIIPKRYGSMRAADACTSLREGIRRTRRHHTAFRAVRGLTDAWFLARVVDKPLHLTHLGRQWATGGYSLCLLKHLHMTSPGLVLSCLRWLRR